MPAISGWPASYDHVNNYVHTLLNVMHSICNWLRLTCFLVVAAILLMTTICPFKFLVHRIMSVRRELRVLAITWCWVPCLLLRASSDSFNVLLISWQQPVPYNLWEAACWAHFKALPTSWFSWLFLPLLSLLHVFPISASTGCYLVAGQVVYSTKAEPKDVFPYTRNQSWHLHVQRVQRNMFKET